MQAERSLGDRKLGLLQPEQHGSPMPGSNHGLLPLSVVGVACSCSSSSCSPTPGDEPLGDWSPPENLIESPTAATHKSCYCCSSSCCSRRDCCSSSTSPAHFKWWGGSTGSNNNSNSNSSKDIDDLESSTVCSSASRPEAPLDLHPSPTAQGDACSSSCSNRNSNSNNNNNNNINSTSTCRSWEDSEGGSLHHHLRPPIDTEHEGPPYSPTALAPPHSSHCSCSPRRETGDGESPPCCDEAPVPQQQQQQQEAARTHLARGSLEVRGPKELGEEAPPQDRGILCVLAQDVRRPPTTRRQIDELSVSSQATDIPPLRCLRSPPLSTKDPAPTSPSPRASEGCSSSTSSSSSGGGLHHPSSGEGPRSARAAAEATPVPPPSSQPGSPPLRGSPSCHPLGERRLCLCLEHLFVGLWGPPCLCGAPLFSGLLGGGACGADGYLVNPQQELEVLLQEASESPAAGEESLSSLGMLLPSASNGKRQEMSCDVLWAHSLSASGTPASSSHATTISISPFPSYPSSPSAGAGGQSISFWGLSCPDASFPVSDWGSPALQWGPPRKGEPESGELSSNKQRGPSDGSWSMSQEMQVGCCRSRGKSLEASSFLGAYWGSGEGASNPRPTLCPRTPLSADSFVSSSALLYSSLSSEDEGEESGDEDGKALPVLSSCSLNYCTRQRGGTSHSSFTPTGARRRVKGYAERDRILGGFSLTGAPLHSQLPPRRRPPGGATFCLRPTPGQTPPLSSSSTNHSGESFHTSLDIWGDTPDIGRPKKPAGGNAGGASVYGGGRWRDTPRDETRHGACSNSPHTSVLGIAAVPVRTRKGFRKPLPLPPEMLAAITSNGSRRPIDPVLQYDGESREWRVFWMEEPQARYKVFQSKKFGKERAQQLALEWLRRAKAGAIHGSGRGGPRAGGPGYRAKRGRSETHALAMEYKHTSSPEMQHLPNPHPSLQFSPANSPSLGPFPTAL